MLQSILNWFGFGTTTHGKSGGHGHSHGDGAGHGHSHGVMDATIATTAKGIWAIKWSFAILAVTAIMQLVVVGISGSVALLADTIHNIGDAGTAIPLWVAFVLARRKSTKTFNYGYGRVEDIAGVLIVLIILVSALVAGYEAIDRLLHPQAITNLWWVVAAGIIGFAGNEAVAVFRIRVGREIDSAALVADGYHARTDGLTSLAVVAGAIGVALGFPLADPIVGLVITVAIFGIVWQSAKSVFTRMLDGLEPGTLEELEHAASHAPGAQIIEVKARWMGHKLHADVAIAVDPTLSLAHANAIAKAVEEEMFEHMPALAYANVRLTVPESDAKPAVASKAGHGHHHAPDPIQVRTLLANGVLEIVDTPEGERMRFTTRQAVPGLAVKVVIDRVAGPETLPMASVANHRTVFVSDIAPAEPHEFKAELQLALGDDSAAFAFEMKEPVGHHH